MTASTPVADDVRPAPVSPHRRNLIFLAIVFGLLMAALDQTIVATALPTIVSDLGNAGHQSWVVTSYLLTSTIATILAGKLGDLFGRKRVFQAAVVCFVAGSVLCGLSASMGMLVAARALQGIGGGAITVTAAALIGEVIPLRDRGRYQGMLGAVFGVTTVIGPLLGGYVTDYLTWRWAFWINLPISVVVLLVAGVAIPALAGRAKPVIDYAGIVLIGLGATGLTLATSWGGSRYPWGSAAIIALFGGSVVALALFVWVENRAAAPILPTRLFADPVFAVCCVLAFVVGFAMLGALTFLPTFMQYVDGVSAITSGLRTLPMVVGMLVTSTGSGALVGRTGRYKIFPVVGTALMTIAFALMSQMNAATPALLQSVYLVILGAGIGLSMQVLVLVVQNTSSFADLGVATSGVTFFRTIGSSFGAAVFGSLFVNFLGHRLGPALSSAGLAAGAADSPEAVRRLSPQQAEPIVAAYADSLGQVFLCAAPVALLGFVLALFLREVPLKELRDSAVDLGDGFGMPTNASSDDLLENAIGRLLHNEPGMRLRSIALRPDCQLDVAGLWTVLRIYRYTQVFRTARLSDIGKRLRVPYEILEPTVDQLVSHGYVLREGDHLGLTRAGLRQVGFVSSLVQDWVVDKLARSPGFEGRPDRAEVSAALERIARRAIIDPDDAGESAEFSSTAHG
ncbi:MULTISPECIES: MDR family MFS transporter [Mycolicibacter]|uniref:MFS transporter n=1 Tax=Mycolicibacter virginiensis TaxID=1795032 RepID=A0A9X7NZ96_9MYCO|nr:MULTISPECIES: MDR family MFS transporter [Mycolicibacter]OBJ29264.1 MFS transporter [Mycolicibacter heraklionensis]PQM52855.1 MFS transporter [Mycolicibacter virginiensis]ULP49558.1 MFS transporter [Mycolicibacter virginiensis]